MLYPYAQWRPGVVTTIYYGQLSPIGVICHYTAAAEPGVSAVDWQQKQVGAHFLVHQNGSIDQFVDTSDLVWHARTASRYYIGIEHVANPQGPGANPPYAYLNETQLSASAALVAYLSLAFGFPVQRSFGCAFNPGIKAHFDGLEPGCTWNSAGHYDGIWQPDVNWLSADISAPLSASPWDWPTYQYATNYYASWFQQYWTYFASNMSNPWYGPMSYGGDASYSAASGY